MSLFSRPAPEPLPLRSKHGVQAAGAAAPAADEGWTIKAADGAHLAAPGCLAPYPQPEAADRRLCPPAAQLDTPAYRDSNELWFTVDLEVTADEVRRQQRAVLGGTRTISTVHAQWLRSCTG